MSQLYNYPQQNSTLMMTTDSCSSSTSVETGSSSYYRQTSLPQHLTRYYSTTTPTHPFR